MGGVSWSWVAGVICAVLANTVSNIGVNVQKLAHSKREKTALEKGKILDTPMSPESSIELDTENSAVNKPDQESYVRDATWMIGMGLQVVGALLDFSSLTLAPQSVVAPLGALTLVINVFLSKIMHNEEFNQKVNVATVVIVLGSVVTVAFSAKEDDIEHIRDVFALYRKITFTLYAVIVGGFMTVLYILKEVMIRYSHANPESYANKWYKVHRSTISILSGTMGAQNILFAKSTGELLELTMSGRGNMFRHWESWLILLALGSSCFFQLRWLNSGLKRFSAMHVVPTFQSFWILVSVVGGLVVYREFDQMKGINKIFFPLGVLITISGVGFLTTQSDPEKLYEAEEETKLSLLKKKYSIDPTNPPPHRDSSGNLRILSNSQSNADNKGGGDGNKELQPLNKSQSKSPNIKHRNSNPPLPIIIDTAANDSTSVKSGENGKIVMPMLRAESEPTPDMSVAGGISSGPTVSKRPSLEIEVASEPLELPSRLQYAPPEPEHKTPPAQRIARRVHELGGGAMIGPASLGRLLVAPHAILPNSDFGVTPSDIVFGIRKSKSVQFGDATLSAIRRDSIAASRERRRSFAGSLEGVRENSTQFFQTLKRIVSVPPPQTPPPPNRGRFQSQDKESHL